jgi:hypothetical protein
MQGLTRLVSVLATCVASLAVVVVLACDKDGGGTPPAPAGDGTPAATSPETTPPPVAGDAPPAEAGTPTEGTGANVTCTPDTRKGGMCTREYSPVCGTLGDNTSKTFSNKCVACSDEKVLRYVAGPCPGEPPA